MLKLTKTGIGLLTKQYRSVLRKCLLKNIKTFLLMTTIINIVPQISYSSQIVMNDSVDYISAEIILNTRSDQNVINGFVVNHYNGSSYSQIVRLYDTWQGGGLLSLSSWDGNISSNLMYNKFRLNNSGYATGIDFASNITAGTTNASHLATTGAVNQLLNYYYTFRVDESNEAIDSSSFFQKDFSTLQKVDLQSKNPTHLGAFAKCDEVCPRPSERFASSLSQEQMFRNDASMDAGTSRHCLRQFGDVVADLLKNTAAKGLRMYEFMNEEVCHA